MSGFAKKISLIFISFILVAFVAFAASPTIELDNRNPSVSNHLMNNVINLFDAANDVETPDNLLVFDILSESNSAIDCYIDIEGGAKYVDCRVVDFGSSGSSLIQVQVRDAEGNTASDYFTVTYSDNGGSGNSSAICSDIDILSDSFSINEDSTETFTLRLRNLNENRDFDIDDIDFIESDSKIRVFDEDFDNTIPEDGTIVVSFDVESLSVSNDRDTFVTIEIRGEFDGGIDCGTGSIRDTIRIWVEDIDDDGGSGSSSSICRDIEISDERIFLDEDDFETVEVDLRNDNSRRFEIDYATVSENSSDLTVSVSSRPNDIGGGDNETLKLRFETEKVSDDETGKITLRLSGHFSNGTNCTASDVSEQISFVIENGGSGSGSDSEIDDIELRFNQSVVDLKPNESKSVLATIENNSNSRKCLELDFSATNSGINASIEDDSICVSADSSKSVDLQLRANSSIAPGNYTARLSAEAGFDTSTKSITVRVLGESLPDASGNLEVLDYQSNVNLGQNDSGAFTVTVSNNSGAALSNVSITLENLPQGIFFQPFFKQRLEKGEIATINSTVKTVNATSGEFNGVLRVSADGKTASRPVNVVVAGGQAGGETPLSGFASFAQAAGTGLVLLAALAIIVLVVAYIVRK